MVGPARAGLFIYAKNLDHMAQFYSDLAGMERRHATPELIVLQSGDIQMMVHQIPKHIAVDIVIESPPIRREDAALKFFFTVPSLDEARIKAKKLGGDVFHENWEGPDFRVCNAIDPEGNVFQVRESIA